MKVSQVQVSDVANYLKLNDGEYTEVELSAYLSAAKAYIKAYTGLDDTAMDTHEDITIVVYVLCQDMYDNRSMYVEKGNLNKVVETILGMYCTNLLPTPGVMTI
ncbi:MAG: head-tail connector protein [Clostridia bacterium]|nr:head-tail connector protein [Clostridia bacterium]